MRLKFNRGGARNSKNKGPYENEITDFCVKIRLKMNAEMINDTRSNTMDNFSFSM